MSINIPPKRKAGELPAERLKPHFSKEYAGYSGYEGPPVDLPGGSSVPENNSPIIGSPFVISDSRAFPKASEEVPSSNDFAGVGVRNEGIEVEPLPKQPGVLDMPVGQRSGAMSAGVKSLEPMPSAAIPSTAPEKTSEDAPKKENFVYITTAPIVEGHPMSLSIPVGVFYPELVIDGPIELHRKYDEPDIFAAYPYGGDDRKGSYFLKEDEEPFQEFRDDGLDGDYSVKYDWHKEPLTLNFEITKDDPQYVSSELEIDTEYYVEFAAFLSNASLPINVKESFVGRYLQEKGYGSIEEEFAEVIDKEPIEDSLGAKDWQAYLARKVETTDIIER